MMIELAVENALKLNPYKIILYVTKNNIECINKVLKYADYSKLISYTILDDDPDRRFLSAAYQCFRHKDVLVMPGNMPLLTFKSLYKLTHENKNIKIQDNLFYMKKEYLKYIDDLYFVQWDYINIPEAELKQVETRGDLDFVNKQVK